MELFDEAKALVRSQKQAYEFTFSRAEIDVRIVLKDLAKFCRANESTFHPDPRTHAVLEGRREVWLRIQKYLNLTPEEIWALKNGE